MPKKTTSRANRADAQTQPMVRLAAPERALNELGLDLGTWKVLTESIFPSTRTPQGILLAVRYCQARNLDVMRRPVHVVPMWSKALGREIETVWPGIAEVQTTAARTGQWAGMDAARFGPDTTRTFRGAGEEGGGLAGHRDHRQLPRLVRGHRLPRGAGDTLSLRRGCTP